jgi:hypothetical protein
LSSARDNDLVREVLAGARPTSQGWAYAKCPLCGSRRASLSIAVETGHWKCFRCGARGRVGGDVEYGTRLSAPPPPKKTDWLSLSDPDVWSSMAAEPAIEYLFRRRVQPQTIQDAQLGVAFSGKLAGRIILPVVDDLGEIVGVVARSWTPSDKPYHNTAGLQRVFMPGRHCLLSPSDVGRYGVEGPFDLLPYWGWAFSFLGKPTDEQLAWIATHTKTPVYIATDGDAHREGKVAAARLALRGVRTSCMRLPAVTDPGEFPLPAPWTVQPNTTNDLRDHA